jgi:hypothetical protein
LSNSIYSIIIKCDEPTYSGYVSQNEKAIQNKKRDTE